MPVHLTITIDDAGRLSVNGPIDNLALCYGLLELAKDSLRTHQAAKTSKAAVAVPTNGDVLTFGRQP